MSFYKLMLLQMRGLFRFVLYTREEGDNYSITCQWMIYQKGY